jgi:hypothetical protein
VLFRARRFYFLTPLFTLLKQGSIFILMTDHPFDFGLETSPSKTIMLGEFQHDFSQTRNHYYRMFVRSIGHRTTVAPSNSGRTTVIVDA